MKILLPIFALFFASSLYSAINIVFDYGDTVQADIDEYGGTFSAAESFWESRLLGYRDTGQFSIPSQVLINIDLEEIDGAGNVLGSAGPSLINTQGTFVETVEGNMRFDTADLGSLVGDGTFEAVIRHEMAHVLGFGTLWDNNGVYTDETGQYFGAGALAAFQVEFDEPDATYVPVELDGGAGTANGHWNMGQDLGSFEATDSRDDPGDSMVYTSVNNGLRLANELMTGFLTGEAWLSNTTLQSFYDIGFNVVPEPSMYALFSGLVAALYVVRRRRPIEALNA